MHAHDVFDDSEQQLQLLDTGQTLDTGQGFLLRLEDFDVDLTATPTTPDALLVVTDQEIHRTDNGIEGFDNIISTLRYFHVNVALKAPDGQPVTDLDGCNVHPVLIYSDDGNTVAELSQTGEKPLLFNVAQLENGQAKVRLKVTVLSSLCMKRNFRVQLEIEGHEHLAARTNEFKTITKLNRGSRGGTAKDLEATAVTDVTFTMPATIPTERRMSVDSLVAQRKRAIDEMEADLQTDPVITSLKARASCLREGTAARDAMFVEDDSLIPAALTHVPRSAEFRGRDDLWREIERNHEMLLALHAQQRALLEGYHALRKSESE